MTYRDEQINTDTKRIVRYEPAGPKMVQLVIRYSGGLIKDEKQANYVLLGFVVIALLIIFVMFFVAVVPDTLERRIPLH